MSNESELSKHLKKQDEADSDWEEAINNLEFDYGVTIDEIIKAARYEAHINGFKFDDIWNAFVGYHK